MTKHRAVLRRIARKAMIERGLLPDFSLAALAELDRILTPALRTEIPLTDLRRLPWCSIDNDDSLDLDQLTAAETMPGNRDKIFVAISDVDTLVKKSSAIDDHARHNTTSVYTAGAIFPMLPERLSTDLTSLNHGADRIAIVIEMVIAEDGSMLGSDVYGATVHNYAKLTYKSVGTWLEGGGPMPEGVAAIGGLSESIRIQDRVAQRMRTLRHVHGALTLDTIRARPVFDADELKDLEAERKNRARDIIEDFMIAANGVSDNYLASKMFPSLRRVVRTPKRWDRIVEIVSEHGGSLPSEPDSRALDQFLIRQRETDPLRFPDLSLSIIKLMGEGEYIARFPGDPQTYHFGLAVKNYTHSTAPNRRYPDLVTQRLLKAAIIGDSVPYRNEELNDLATHCTQEEDVVKKVERQVGKSAAAMLLASRIGERFDAIVTGSAPKGTWVRLFHPPVEGKLIYGFEGVDVGHRIRVQLVHTDIERGFIDFRRVH